VKGTRFNRRLRRTALVAATPLLTTLLGACTIQQSRLDVIDFAEDGSTNHYVESFDEAYYDIDDNGNLDLILRRANAGRMADELDLTQVVHIRSIWRSIPGQTIAHDDQINATINYAIMASSTGHTFEGAGSVFFRVSKRKGVLTGELGRAVVKPSRQTSPTRPLFSRAALSGSFRAIYDPKQVKLIKNELRRIFGPHPVG
jgi:hypothetical protein